MPRKPKLMRTSERTDFQNCQWYWYQVWIMGWSATRVPTWAWFGTAIHIAMQIRYPVGRKRGHMADVLDGFEAAVADEKAKIYTGGQEPEDDPEEKVDAVTLGKAMLIGYEKKWGLDQRWEVIHSEQPFQINVPDWRNPDRVLVVYCGTFDMVVYDRQTKRFYVVDHKTRKAFPRIWTFLDLNTQAGSYLWVAPEVLRHMGVFTQKNQRVSGLIFNMLRKSLPDDRPVNAKGEALNKDGSVSARQQSKLFDRYTSDRGVEQRVRQARHVANEAKAMHRIIVGLDEPQKHNSEDCIRCPLFDMCQLDEIDPEQGLEYANAVMHKRDPYADHREDMTEKNGVAL